MPQGRRVRSWLRTKAKFKKLRLFVRNFLTHCGLASSIDFPDMVAYGRAATRTHGPARPRAREAGRWGVESSSETVDLNWTISAFSHTLTTPQENTNRLRKGTGTMDFTAMSAEQILDLAKIDPEYAAVRQLLLTN